jgi:hypothetical protein
VRPSPRRALLDRIERERIAERQMPGLPASWRARAAIAAESGQWPADLAHAADRELHAIAAATGAAFAEALARGDDRSIEQRGRELIRSWAALATRAAYVERCRHAWASEAVPADVAQIGVDRVVRALAARASEGADLGALLRALDAAAPDVRIERARRDAIDVAAAPARAALDELATRRPTIEESIAVFGAMVGTWRRCDRDVELEILAVERLGDFAWDLYRDRPRVELARLVAIVAEPVASLAARVERGEPAIAWAAPCAQALVFQAESAADLDAQITIAERAYAVCPTLRNARIVLADLLLTRAERAIDRGVTRAREGTPPEQDVARAATIHPDLVRLPKVREKLARATRRT